ncbi:sialidase family protein [Pyxidicoccus xibeiensis]|uniref:sialidase family protein n=1 Tax=Pyxidicoccus xibeiensis TaxID=2906759 RepID=UPI0020A70670|nr:sialidase family protein [Pyxidicoccus xibeiensis]MCP3139512.1 glycoside hydrolase [Pyxidicoccus xibeiensis]
MTGLAGALLAAVLAAGGTPLVPVSGGNALTLPAQRHIVHIETGSGRPPTWLVAIQHGGVEGKGLVLYRSEDGLRSVRRVADVQPDATHTDRAELLAVGRDVALLYSYEGARLEPSRRHDVYFQWWRYQSGSDTWAPEPAVRVLDTPDDSTGFSRALLARDSRGRLWVQAFRLERDGSSTAVVSVSTDGGQSFVRQPDLGRVKRRGGGRLLSVGTKLVFFYAMHDGFEPTRMRVRNDSDPLDTWSPVRDAFSDGIYHGAALSAVEDGKGGIHLVYKDETERLYYRHFDGADFGPRILVEGTSDWAMQAATTRIGDTLYVFYNRMRVLNAHYELRVRVLKDGVFGGAVTLDGETTFKGYLNAVDVLPADSTEVPCLFGDSPDASSRGTVSRVALSVQPPPPPLDGGTPWPDGGTGTDAGTPGPDGGTDGGTPWPDGGVDAGTPGPDGGVGTDGGTPGTDGGTPVPDGGTSGPFTLEPVHTNTTHEVLAVDGAGTVYALALGSSRSRLVASTDGGRTFTPRGQDGGSLWTMAAMKNGTLLAVVSRSGVYSLQRSTDGGSTWKDPVSLGNYRAQGPRSFAELGSTFFFLEYQTFTSSSVPVRLWASGDGGATWAVRSTLTAHRHGYSLFSDVTTGALWATLGSSKTQSAVLRSADGGRTWSTVLGGYAANGVAGVVQSDGSLLLGQSTLYQPEYPKLLRLFPSGRVDALLQLPGPVYSLLPVPGGGWAMGTGWASSGDVHAPGDVYARIFISGNGVSWAEALRYERLSSTAFARADVWGVLSTGELLVRMENVRGFGTSGMGFQVLRVKR